MPVPVSKRAYLIAFAAGVPLAWYQFKISAAVWLVPGFHDLIRAIVAAHLPLRASVAFVVGWLPIVPLAFLIGVLLRRFVRGVGVGHLLVCAAPAVIYSAALTVYVYAGSDVDWPIGFFDWLDRARIPIGMLLAAFVPPGHARGPGEHTTGPVRPSMEG
jgi:uncharacterized membrane protein